MARRRLHGATQKRRQKRRLRALKRVGSIARVEAVSRPMEHEVSPVVEPDDLRFLDTMRDMKVKRLSGARMEPVREQAIEKTRKAVETENERMFREAMEAMGVKGLKDATPARPKEPARAATTPPSAPPRPPPPPAPSEARPASPTRPQPVSGVRVEATAEDAALMEAALDAALDPLAAKFEGAPAPPASRPARRARRPGGDPDAELDLHGATEATALRRLQDFLVSARRQGLRDVLVITGRGLNSGERGPVLRGAVERWLDSHGTLHVREVLPAPPRHGGEGALWLVLR